MDPKLTIENVNVLSAGTSTKGTLKLTNFHIVFCAPVPTPPLPPPKDTPARSSNDSSSTPTPFAEPNKQKPQPPTPAPVRQRESWITYPIIAHCTFRPTPPSSGVPASIRIRCRDFNIVCFSFADSKLARDAFEFIRDRTCRLGSIEKLYAFSYVPPRQEKAICGWDVYDARAEFRRQGISEKLPDRGWRISHINKDYAFSPTYPSVLVVPSKISDNVLKYAGQFRSRARIPALTYYHPITQCSITRSSQPLVGVRGNRSIQDERLVSACFYKSTAVFSTGGSDGTAAHSNNADDNNNGPGSNAASTGGDSNGSGSNDTMIVTYDGVAEAVAEVDRIGAAAATADDLALEADDGSDAKPGNRVVGARRDNLIVDARPAINSLAMQVVGKGSENMEHYKSATKVFLSIDNIHVMRDSLNKVIEAVKDADISPLPPNQNLLAKSDWLRHIRGILTGSQTIARAVGVSAAHVLIHCSDGWDRTSQLSGLSQIMLDPYYRTIDGFIVLIEKDWLAFGHMFQQRSGHLNSEKWFVTQNDAMAGTKIDPSENDGRNEFVDNAVASARRFFKKSLSQDKESSDGDGAGDGGGEDPPSSRTPTIEEGQATRPREISPVFHQFLDATYQMLRQHPTRFEFNERFLRRLLYHLYSCQYGTFLYNNERQRRDAKVRERTSSVWDYFLSRRAEFTNPQYDASAMAAADDSNNGMSGGGRQDDRLLFCNLDQIRWWHQAFNRTDQDMNSALNAAAAATAERTANTANYHATMTSTTVAPATVIVTPGDDDPVASARNARSSQSVSPSPRRGASPVPPPSFQTSQSAGAELESTPSQPNAATARAMLATPVNDHEDSSPSFQRSGSSANEPGAFAVIREGIAGLGLGQKVGGVIGTLTSVGSSIGGGGSNTATSIANAFSNSNEGGSGGASGSGSGSGSVVSNINGREALFGLAGDDDENDSGSNTGGGVFDSFVGGSGSRRSRQMNRSNGEQELRDM
ncbi:phosphatidylinositol-3-phosphatase ymr1 [Sporothrix stenoceras]|uniref:Phosphatidylinositol-3-phosphatase ymr1 n=1 Tax=Sporothrix stenoceras TaxID=5173 RepID=A0ABR3ZEZ8_9PEZI